MQIISDWSKNLKPVICEQTNGNYLIGIVTLNYEIAYKFCNIIKGDIFGGVRGVMVIIIGNGHGDTSSNPGRDW